MTGKESVNIRISNDCDTIRLMIYHRSKILETLADSLKKSHDRALEHIKNIKDIVVEL